MNEISLIKNNERRQIDDVEWLQEFYEFLQGQVPEGIYFGRGHAPKLSAKKAFSIIYYLQEKMPVFPDHIEQCWNCGRLFDAHREGLYWGSRGRHYRHYCGSCTYLVPEKYDRGKR